MQKKWIKLSLLLIGFLTFVIPFSTSNAATEQVAAQQSPENRVEKLLHDYKEQQAHIEKIKNYKINNSTLEKEALAYRLFSRHLSAFETLNKLSTLLIKQKKIADENPAVLSELDIIINQNNEALEAGINHLQERFNKAHAEQERYSIESLHLYIEHLTLLDKVYKAMAQQVLNQEALGFDASESKAFLIAQLYNRAESFSGMLELVVKKRGELNTLIALKADNQSLKDSLAVVNEQLVIARESFGLTVELLTQLGFDVTFYQQTLLNLGGQITTDILDVGILTDIVNRFVSRVTESIVEYGGEWFFKLLLLIAIYYIFKTLSKIARNVLEKSLNSSKVRLSSLMRGMIISSVGRLIMILGLFIALAQFGISLAPILAGLGVAGFIIGFALQDTLSNFASGMMILIYRPYDVGDLVEVGGGVFGKVDSMNLVSTTIMTIDNQTLVIPNSKIWGDVIKNVTSQKLRRVDLVFGIGYSDDIEKTEAVLNELVNAHPLVLNDPEPTIKLHVLNESSVDFVVRPWVNTEDYWDVYWDLTRQVKLRFDKDGISIPFPQRDVHFYPAATSEE